MAFSSDLEIARSAALKPLEGIAEEMGIASHLLEPYGEQVMKIKLSAIEELADRDSAKYVVVSAVTPTPLGEGKTTTTVGLGQGFRHIGKRATIAIRQPSMGPTFGIKGGAAGGGYSQVVPMEVLNLHLTGDVHAVTAAHNLLAAMIDNHIYQGNQLGIDIHNITWRRVLDVNDRALRNIIIGLGGRADGVPRQTGFDITAASEVMATLALAASLQRPAGPARTIVVGYTTTGRRSPPNNCRGRGRWPSCCATRSSRTCSRPSRTRRCSCTPAVRQHRDRQLVSDRRPYRYPLRRLPGHRSGLRGRHGSRAVLQHQVPDSGLRPTRPSWSPRCGRSRPTRASTRSLRAARSRRTSCGRTQRTWPPEEPTSASRSTTSACTAFPPWWPSTASPPTTQRAPGHQGHRRRPGSPVGGMHPFRRWRTRRRRTGRGGGRGRRRAVGIPFPLPRLGSLREKIATWPPGSTAPTASTTPAGRRPDRHLRAGRVRTPARLHRQDPPVHLVRPRAQRRADRLAAAGQRGAGLGRRRIRLPDLRRHADHAGARFQPGGHPHRHRRGWAGHGVVVTSFLDQPVWQFLDQVAARSPSPGGGGAAAVTAALAAGLVAMAARFSDGQLPDAAELTGRADQLRRRAAGLADEDGRAYQAVLDAYALSREHDQRRQRVREALQGAAAVPLEITEIAAQVAELAAWSPPRATPMCVATPLPRPSWPRHRPGVPRASLTSMLIWECLTRTCSRRAALGTASAHAVARQITAAQEEPAGCGHRTESAPSRAPAPHGLVFCAGPTR